MAKWLKENSTLPDKELWVSQLKTTKLMLIGLLAMNTNLWMVLLSHGRPPESCTGSYETGSWFEPLGGRTALWCVILDWNLSERSNRLAFSSQLFMTDMSVCFTCVEMLLRENVGLWNEKCIYGDVIFTKVYKDVHVRHFQIWTAT